MSPAAPLPHKYFNLSVLLHPYQVHASSPKTYPVGYASPTTNLDTIAIPQKGQFLSIPHKMHRAFKLNYFQLSDKKTFSFNKVKPERRLTEKSGFFVRKL